MTNQELLISYITQAYQLPAVLAGIRREKRLPSGLGIRCSRWHSVGCILETDKVRVSSCRQWTGEQEGCTDQLV